MREEKIKAWYDQRHFAKGEDAWRPFEAYGVFLDCLAVKAGKRFLDVGCGTGFLLKAAEQRDLETFGVDLSDEAVKIAKMVSPNSSIAQGKGEDLVFPDQTFDYIACIGALEHFLDLKKGIRELVRVGKPEALYCVVLPNRDFLPWKIGRSKGTEQQDVNEHLFTLNQWREILAVNGLTVHQVYPDRWPAKKSRVFSSFNLLVIFKNLASKAFWHFLPLQYTYQFVFIATKKRRGKDG